MIDDKTVGMENLPNVFIDNILVQPLEDASRMSITVYLCVYDKKQPENSWRGRDDIDLKIHVAFENRTEVIENLNNGTISLYNRVPHHPPETGNPDIAQLKVAQWQPIIKEGSGLANQFIEGDYDKFVFNVTRTFDGTPDLNVYAACFVDNLGFDDHPIFSKYYGPMSAESIFVGGQVNNMSFYFYYPDTNEEYGGPVHQKPNGSYMEGSVHSEDPHEEVVLVAEENYKIQAPHGYTGLGSSGITSRTGFVSIPEDDSDPNLGPTTNIPDSDPEVEVEDPDVPDEPLNEIGEGSSGY